MILPWPKNFAKPPWTWRKYASRLEFRISALGICSAGQGLCAIESPPKEFAEALTNIKAYTGQS
jgi:hypothetical protein